MCRQQVSELAAHEQAFIDNHRHLVVIGSAQPDALGEFRKTTGYRGTLLTDPSCEAFALLGYTRGILSLVGWRPLAASIEAVRSGFRPGAVHGNAMQNGGALVVDTDGSRLFVYRSEKAGDHPTVSQLLGRA